MTTRHAAVLTLTVALALTFLPVLVNGFVFDDHLYLLGNERIWSGLTAVEAREHYLAAEKGSPGDPRFRKALTTLSGGSSPDR